MNCLDDAFLVLLQMRGHGFDFQLQLFLEGALLGSIVVRYIVWSTVFHFGGLYILCYIVSCMPHQVDDMEPSSWVFHRAQGVRGPLQYFSLFVHFG